MSSRGGDGLDGPPLEGSSSGSAVVMMTGGDVIVGVVNVGRTSGKEANTGWDAVYKVMIRAR